MTDGLRVALFVEGSSDVGVRRTVSWLSEIWSGHLASLTGHPAFELVVPISKKDLVAMDDAAPRPTGTEPLDMKMRRYGAGSVFHSAIVAWDLHPEWNELGTFCRWDETVRLCDLLARSRALPEHWRSQAAARAADYNQRGTPSERRSLPRLVDGVILPLCMEPEFEALLTSREVATLRALGFSSRPSGWPSGWGPGATRRPAEEVLRVAVECVPRASPARRRVRGSWRGNKNEWGEYILRQLLADADGREAIRRHPMVERLADMR